MGIRGRAALARRGPRCRGRDGPACSASAPPSPSSRCRSRRSSFPPRASSPRRSSRRSAPPTPTTAPPTPTGSRYRDIVRAFRGRFDHPPDVVALPRDETEVERVLEWCESAGAAVVPYGGGTSVVGGVEPRGDYAGRLARPQPRSTACSRSTTVSRAARIQAGALGPALEDQLHEHGLHPAPLPAVLPVLDAWAAGSPPAPAATSPRSTRTSTTSSSPCARSRPRGTWESRRLPGSGAGPTPDRMLIGSEGTLGVITEAWVRVRPRPDAPGLGGGALPRLRRGGATPCAPSRSRASIRANCRLHRRRARRR